MSRVSRRGIRDIIVYYYHHRRRRECGDDVSTKNSVHNTYINVRESHRHNITAIRRVYNSMLAYVIIRRKILYDNTSETNYIVLIFILCV